MIMLSGGLCDAVFSFSLLLPEFYVGVIVGSRGA